MTPAGIEPATFRFVEQLLNHCATAVPICLVSRLVKCIPNDSGKWWALLHVRSIQASILARKTGGTDWDATVLSRYWYGDHPTLYTGEVGRGLKLITCASFCVPGWGSQYCDQATGSTVQNSNSGTDKTPFSNISRQFLWSIQPPIQRVPGFFPGVKRLECVVTTQLYLVRTLRMNGAIPPLTCMLSWHREQQHYLQYFNVSFYALSNL